jgi:hypothetical protein
MDPRRRPEQPRHRWTRAGFAAVFAATVLALVVSALPAFASEISVRSTDPAGEADLVTEGANNTLQYYWATPGGAWHHTQVADAGTTYSAPSVFVRSTDPTGEADIVAEGPDDTLQYYWATPGSPWNNTQVADAGTTYGRLIAVRPTHHGSR